MKLPSHLSSILTFQPSHPKVVEHQNSSSMVCSNTTATCRARMLKAPKDSFLASVLNLISSSKYTVLYTTTPISSEQLSTMTNAEDYQIETNFQSAVHMELKRDFSAHNRESNHSTTPRSIPIFEKYMFFGPGLFMGLLAAFLLLSILYIGISGIASLQVTYAAFDREMGPAANKKQSQ